MNEHAFALIVVSTPPQGIEERLAEYEERVLGVRSQQTVKSQ
jgi:hypothetical protein